LSYVFVAFIASVVGSLITRHFFSNVSSQPELIKKIIERPLDKYSFDSLINTGVTKGEIKMGEVIKEYDDYTSYLFTHEFDPTLINSVNKKVTGQINIPKGNGPFPIILQFRGYVDQSIYQTGVGTRRSGEMYAKAGFITVAPDFLGYGESDTNALSVLEGRFQAYTTGLSVLAAIDSLPQWDKKNIFLWGHSNGGLIALTVLEITGLPIPTTLWAPVSKPFPYSVLYYTDESLDKGKFLRKQISDFESLYEAEKYSFENYLDRIKAPLQIHQGTGDDAVPLAWSNLLVSNLRKVKLSEEEMLSVEYHTYPGGDHNLTPGWDTVVERNIEFFKKNLK